MAPDSKASIRSPKLSLSDLLGKPYVDAVCEASAFVQGTDKRALVAVAEVTFENGEKTIFREIFLFDPAEN